MHGTFTIAVAIIFSCTAVAQNSEKVVEHPRAPMGVEDFEQSAFCHKYECFLKAVEPMHFRDNWYYFYNYRVFPANADPEKQMYKMQIGMTVTAEGTRSYPYMIVRWFPLQSAPVSEFAVISDLVREITGDSNFDATNFIGRFTQHLDFKRRPAGEAEGEHRGPFAKFGSRHLKLSFTRGADKCRYPQLTLMVE